MRLPLVALDANVEGDGRHRRRLSSFCRCAFRRCLASYCYLARSLDGPVRTVAVCMHAWRRGGIYTQDNRRAIQVIGVRCEEFTGNLTPFVFTFTLCI
jgi:hypothetical protein